MPATIRPPGLSQRAHAGRLGLPQRVAQVLGDRQDVGELVGRVGGGDLGAAERGLGLRRGHGGRVLTREVWRTAAPDGAAATAPLRTRALRRAAGRPGRPARRGPATLPAPSIDARPDDRAAGRRCSPAPTCAPGATIASRTVDPRPITASASTTEPVDGRARLEAHAVAEHGVGAHDGALRRSCTPSPSTAGRAGARRPCSPRRARRRARPAARARRSARCPARMSAVALQVALGRPDVDPVGAVVRVAVEARRRRARARPRARSRRCGRAG